MKTQELEIVIMRHFGIRANLIVPNVSWGMGLAYEADLVVLGKGDFATEIELKISKSDLLRDKFKEHGHDSKLFARLFFAVPEELEDLALFEIPERAGLLSVRKNSNGYQYVQQLRSPKRNPKCIKWDLQKRYELARLGTMRILGLKEAINSK